MVALFFISFVLPSASRLLFRIPDPQPAHPLQEPSCLLNTPWTGICPQTLHCTRYPSSRTQPARRLSLSLPLLFQQQARISNSVTTDTIPIYFYVCQA